MWWDISAFVLKELHRDPCILLLVRIYFYYFYRVLGIHWGLASSLRSRNIWSPHKKASVLFSFESCLWKYTELPERGFYLQGHLLPGCALYPNVHVSYYSWGCFCYCRNSLCRSPCERGKEFCEWACELQSVADF